MMPYRDSEERKRMKRESARKRRGTTNGSTEMLQGSTKVGDVDPLGVGTVVKVDPFSVKVDPFVEPKVAPDGSRLCSGCAERDDRISVLMDKNDDLQFRIGGLLSDAAILRKKGNKGVGAKDNTADGSGEWRTAMCSKHGSNPVRGRWVCCGE